MTRYIVYCHTNKLNGKSYIGWALVKKNQSLYEAMMRRWKDHCWHVDHNSHYLFHNAIRKNGLDVWDHEVIEVVQTREAIKHAEKLWILQRRSCIFEHNGRGYNMTHGGDGGGMLGKKVSDVTRKKLSERGKGRKPSDKTRQLWSQARKGRKLSIEHRKKIQTSMQKYRQAHPNWNLGMKMSDEYREKLRQSHLGKPHPQRCSRCKMIGHRAKKCQNASI